jgi:hypothetical protein
LSRGALGCCRACINESKAVTKSGCCAGFREALGVRTRPPVAFKKQYSISRFTRYGNVETMKAMRGRIALPKHFVRNLDARRKKIAPGNFLHGAISLKNSQKDSGFRLLRVRGFLALRFQLSELLG